MKFFRGSALWSVMKNYKVGRFKFFSLLLVLLVGETPAVFAQSDPPVGASAEVLQKKSREEMKQYFSQASGRGDESKIEEPDAPETQVAKELSFELKEVILDSGSVPPSLYSDYINRKVQSGDIREVMQRIGAFYREKGLIAVVFLPPQEIRDGKLHLGVIVSEMGSLNIEGVRYSSAFRIRKYWIPAARKPLKYDEIKKSLARMNRHPDRKVRAVLKAGQEKGTTDIFLKAQERLPVHAGASFDNQGVKTAGKKRVGLWLKHNNLLRLDDQFLIGTVFGKTYGSVYLNHSIPVNRFGTSVNWGFTHTQVTPLKEFKVLGINGTAETYSLGVRQEILELSNMILEGYGRFDFKEKRTRQQSVTAVRDRLRVLSWGLDFQNWDSKGFWSLEDGVAFGLPLTGDGHPLTSRRAESSFVRFFGDLKRVQKLKWGTKGTATAGYQLSPDKLPPSEQFFLGGGNSVRGYPESDYGSDQNIHAGVELSVPSYFFPEDWMAPWTKQSLRESIQGVVFFDYGYGRLRDPSSRETRSRALAGAGGGFSVRILRNLFLRLEWAAPLLDEPLTEGGNSQFYVRTQAEI